MQGGAVRIHIRVLANHDNAFALIRVAEMRHDDLHIRKANGHLVEQNRPSESQRSFVDKRRTCVQKNRQIMLRCVLPQIIQFRRIRIEPGVHRKQFDSLQLQILVPGNQLVRQPGCWIDTHETNQPVRMCVDITGDFRVRDPDAGELSLCLQTRWSATPILQA